MDGRNEPQKDLKAFTLQMPPACIEAFDARVGSVNILPLYVGAAAARNDCRKFERVRL